MRSIVVVPGRSPAWVDQHARHVAQRLTVHGRVMVAFTHGQSRATVMPGEMGRETVLGAGQSGHPVWTGHVGAALGLRGSREATVLIWWAGASAVLGIVAAVVARLRRERLILDEELPTEPSLRGERFALAVLRRLATARIAGMPGAGPDGPRGRVALAIAQDDRTFTTQVLRAFAGFSESVVGDWTLRLHTTFDAEPLLDELAVRNRHRIVLEQGIASATTIAGATVVVTPADAPWASLAELAARSGAAGVVVGHAVAGRIARTGTGLWLATDDPSSILVAIEASTGAAVDAPVSVEGLRAASDRVVATVAALAQP